MEKTNTILLFFLSFFVCSATLADDTAVYVPTENIAVDCGSLTNTTNELDRTWLADSNTTYFILESESKTNRSNITEATRQPSSGNTPPYMLARYSYCEFNYVFRVTAGQKFIRLYFNPTSSYPNLDPGKAFFSVKANQFTLFNNFSAFLNLNPGEDIMSREFSVNIRQNQTLNITFTPTSGDYYAFINGIEIVSMPTKLYYVKAKDFKLLGYDSLGMNTARETMHRINVGGKSLSAIEDTTGMYRKWMDDVRYLTIGKPSALPVNLSIHLSFTAVPNYSAPVKIYQTARSMGINKTMNENYYLTWEFPVDSGFIYLVRLHFCEFQFEIVNQGDRVFQIEIANQTAETAADVIAWSGGNGIPVYRDYGVFIGVKGDEKKQNISVALHTTPEWRTKYSDAILNGVEIFKMSNSGNLSAPNPDNQSTFPVFVANSPRKESRKHLIRNLAIAFPVSLVGLMVALVSTIFVYKRLVYLCEKNVIIDNQNIEEFIRNNRSIAPKRFTYSEVKKMTNSFSDIVGKGGFGSVYRGKLPDGSLVAVKVLSDSKTTNGEDFINEVASMSRTSHVNILSLIGFCLDKTKRAIIYEFIANGSLDKFILYKAIDSETKHNLDLQTLEKIAVGVARGLEYLHRGCNTRIVHFDIKPHNILLDDEFCPKISDFGLAKLNQSKESIISMIGARGTAGYIAPEVFSKSFGRASHKSDVYSYGMMVLEMVGGRRNLDRGVSKTSEMYFPDWIYNQLEQNEKVRVCGDLTEDDERRARKMIIVSMWCIQTIPSNRPTMSKVVEMLEGSFESLQIPPKPVLSSPQRSRKISLTTSSFEIEEL